MINYIIKRVGIALLTIWLILTVVFFLVRMLPGDAVLSMAGQSPKGMTAEQRANLRHKLGLDRPVHIQYVDWLSKAVQGDLGISINSRRPVLRDVLVRIPRTIELTIIALIIGLIIALPGGVISALHRNSFIDVSINGVLVLLGSTPTYIVGLFLLLLFGLHLGWVPTGGFVEFHKNPGQHIRLLILPSLNLGLWIGAVAGRMTRHSMLEVLSQDYIRTAFAKGLSKRVVYYVHALKNAMIPVVTAIGLQVGALLGGAVLTEVVFTWPGLGSAFVSSVMRRDYPTIQGILIVTITMFIFTNLIVDILVMFLDPRISKE
ncbi:MAG: ABC transporter permease [Pseudomonadota bacterium]